MREINTAIKQNIIQLFRLYGCAGFPGQSVYFGRPAVRLTQTTRCSLRVTKRVIERVTDAFADAFKIS